LHKLIFIKIYEFKTDQNKKRKKRFICFFLLIQ